MIMRGVFLLVFLTFKGLVTYAQVTDDSRPTVTIAQFGTLRGTIMKTITGIPIKAFRSVPYAKPPLGNLRFAEPVEYPPWDSTLDASAKSPRCIQSNIFKGFVIEGQEDCLYLEVYTRRIANDVNEIKPKAPVIVTFHDGAFVSGNLHFHGPTYLLEHNCVLVTVNYRLGPFGFLYTGDNVVPGNAGMKDQVLALKWVQKHIAHFGGDGNRVTIYGNMGAHVHYHLLSQMSRGLFHNAVMTSGSAFCLWAYNIEGVKPTKKLAMLLGCPTTNSTKMVDCLRSHTGENIVAKHVPMQDWTPFPFTNDWIPTVEPVDSSRPFLTAPPEVLHQRGDVANVPIMAGVNSDDGAIIAAVVYKRPGCLDQFNDRSLWYRAGPLSQGLKNRVPGGTLQETIVATKIRERYMGRQWDFTFNSRRRAVSMFTDRHFHLCALKAWRYLVNVNHLKVYTYYFDYAGKYSLTSGFDLDPIDWGVTHMDNDIYLFDNPDMYNTIQLGEPDDDMVVLYTDLLYNFANNGTPSSSSLNMRVQWEPNDGKVDRIDMDGSNLKMLRINLPTSMQTMSNLSFVVNAPFFRSLQINEAPDAPENGTKIITQTVPETVTETTTKEIRHVLAGPGFMIKEQ